MKLNKKLLALISMLSVVAMSGCTPKTQTSVDDNTKLAYASSSALSLVNTSSSSISGGKEARRAWSDLDLSFDTDAITSTFEDLVEQFDLLFDAQEHVEVTVIENEGGEFAYTSNISIGENDEFTYSLNYNTEVKEHSVTSIGEVVINYVPLEMNFTLDYESSIVYEDGVSVINFKLYMNLLKEEDHTSYIEVKEVLDTKELTGNKFDYKLVINNATILEYSIEIPVADDNTLVVNLGALSFTVNREVDGNNIKIVITMGYGDVTLFNITFEKKEDSEGKITYSITANK